MEPTGETPRDIPSEQVESTTNTDDIRPSLIEIFFHEGFSTDEAQRALQETFIAGLEAQVHLLANNPEMNADTLTETAKKAILAQRNTDDENLRTQLHQIAAIHSLAAKRLTGQTARLI